MDRDRGEGGAVPDRDAIDMVRAHADMPADDLDATLRWAKARADQILAELSPDSELLGLLRGDDRPVAAAPKRRRTQLGIPALANALPPRPSARPPPSSSMPPPPKGTATFRASPPPATDGEASVPTDAEDAPPRTTALDATPTPPSAEASKRALAQIAAMMRREVGTGEAVSLDLPPSDLAPPDPQAVDGTNVGTVGASPFARFLPESPASSAAVAEPEPLPPEPMAWPPAPQRRHPRYELHQPVQIRYEGWDEVVQMATHDISRGGMFVATEEAPPLRDTISVLVELPDGAGKLTLEGEVVHVVTPQAAAGQPAGFGLQFAALTDERKARLDQLVEHARRMASDPSAQAQTLQQLGIASSETGTRLQLSLNERERHQLRELTAELATIRDRSDDELLGISAPSDVAQVRAAFGTLAARWQRILDDAQALPELRTIAQEVVARLAGARDRVTEAAARRAEAEVEAEAEAEAEAATRQAAARQAAAARRSPTPKAGLVQRLLHRGGQLAERLSAPSPSPSPSTPPVSVPRPAARGRMAFNKRVGEGFEHLSAKRYEEAIAAFERAVVQRPDSTKARVLLLFSQARKAVRDKQLDEAKRKYEEVLELDPDNATAQRDLVMLSCLS